jgi:hypothetical protein
MSGKTSVLSSTSATVSNVLLQLIDHTEVIMTVREYVRVVEGNERGDSTAKRVS